MRNLYVIARWLLLCAILGSNFPGAGLVLCVGPNDHFALELKNAADDCGGCATGAIATPDDSTSGSLLTADCACLDVTLSSNGLLTGLNPQKRLTPGTVDVSPNPPSTPRLFLAGRSPDPRRCAETAPAASLLHQRTVVLLI